MRPADIVRDAFAGLTPTPANPANPANGRANAGFQPLRTLANVCESGANPVETLAEIRKDSQPFASPEGRANARDSQDSQHSQGVGAGNRSQADLAAICWSDDDIQRFGARRDRLLRWGWSEAEAERLAERLTLRDRAGDDRRVCLECGHHRPGNCGNHRAALLATADVGRDLACVLQRCPGFGRSRE